MSTPADQLPQQTGAMIAGGQPPSLGGQPVIPPSGAAGGSDPALQQLLSGYEDSLGKQQQVAEEQVGSIQQEEQQLQSQPAPSVNRGAMFPMPYLVALAAIGGSAMGMHGRVMLGALAGLAKGAIAGDEQAYADNAKKYDEQQAKMVQLAKLQNDYYNTLYEAYGKTAEGQMQAIMTARELTNDQLTREMDLAKIGMSQVSAWNAQQRLAAEIKHWNAQDNTAELKAQLDLIKAKKDATANGGVGGSGFTPEAIHYAALQTLKTGTVPNMGMSKDATNARIQIINAAAAMASQMPGGQARAIANQQVYKATSLELSRVSTMKGIIQTYEDSAKRQAQLVMGASEGFPRSQYAIVNKALLKGETEIKSDPAASKLLNSIMVFSNEYAKVMTGQTTGAAVSDAARKEGQQITSAAMSGRTLQEVMAQEIQSMENRMRSFDGVTSVLQQQLQGLNNPDNITGYTSVDQLKAAYKAGKITSQQAAEIASQNGWPIQ